ncbi:MAG: hypothetical protein ABH862_06905 [Candidatus Omnitrophota bacterium]
MELSFVIVGVGFLIIACFEIRIVTYLRQMRDLLRELRDKM